MRESEREREGHREREREREREERERGTERKRERYREIVLLILHTTTQLSARRRPDHALRQADRKRKSGPERTTISVCPRRFFRNLRNDVNSAQIKIYIWDR